MKKATIFLAIVLLGVGAYFGYYGVQRVLINMHLKMMLAECDPTDNDPDRAWFKERVCQIEEEENRQFKQIASSSKTDKEFQEKCAKLVEQWVKEDKMGQLREQFKQRKQSK